jgi:tRNA (mo5U34)-methyltransferase
VKEYSHLKSGSCDFTAPAVKIGSPDEIDDNLRAEMRESLLSMSPWRKGPFDVFGIKIDCEWRSDLKWDRVIGHLKPLTKRHILDIGSSNGYYMYRMLEHNPAMVMGIDPYTNFYYQFMMLNSIADIKNIFTLPLKFEDTVTLTKKFNTIFCMGILYHRKSPIEFLSQIKKMLTADGELVLETLIIEGDSHTALVPEERYAKMPNVYFIPTVPVLFTWLKSAGFKNIKCVDVSVTTIEEQRKTEWINTETLADFLDPADSSKTIEGYPAPVRAVVIAELSISI